MSIYTEYASVYDRSGQLAFSLRMIPYLEALLGRHTAVGKVMLELACGTGTVAIAMAERGWEVYAVDGSAQMLAEAQAKARDHDVSITWSQQDMRRVVLPAQVGLATCLYDSMNYMLTSEDLSSVFAQVHSALLPGGVFLFDMITAWALSTQWDNETYFTEHEGLSMIMQSDYDPTRQRASVRVICYVEQGGLYRKIEEQHVEQAYPAEQIATLLTDVGLHVEAHYECFTFQSHRPTTYRIMWVTRRPAIEGVPRRTV